MAWDFSTAPEFEAKLDWARDYVRDHVLPLETLGLDHDQYRRIAAELSQPVREQGLWAAHLPEELGGQGLGQLELALLNEIVGVSDFAPRIFGSQAPDSGNSEILAIAATPEQKQRWMAPLLAGELASAFAMSEPGTGSDPRQFTGRAVLDGDEWVINAHKWFVGNASRSDFHIVMVVTEPDARPHDRASLLIVPIDVAGIEMRELGMMSDPDADGAIHTHCEVFYRDVRVPAANLLGARGDGFRIAQRRLGPGRLQHAMRWLGVSRRALDMLCERAVSTTVHGGLLADKQFVQGWIADAAVQLEAARLLTLQAAWKFDRLGSKAVRRDIAMIKYFGSAVMHDVIDKAIQVHGSLGFSTDLPLEHMYRWSRAARIYDGPDEVHRVTVARDVLAGYTPVATPTEHVPTRRAAARERFGALLDAAAGNA